MIVKDMLNYLGQTSLMRLINLRNLKTSRTLDQKKITLAYSYRGNLSELIEQLRKEDLINILKNGVTFKEDEYFIPNLSKMKIREIQKLAIDIFCNHIKSEKLVPMSEENDISLFSGKYFKDDIYHLNLNIFQEALKSSNEIYIISAYYDQTFFKKLFSKSTFKKFKKIHIIFNGLSGQRLKDQKTDLKELFEFLKEHSINCDIHLKMEQGIFHSKLYMFKGRTTTTFVGSINSTNAGLMNNEEILIKMSGERIPFEKYFKDIWKKSTPFDKTNEPKAKTLIGFFRMGVLYFKPEYQFQFSYNPFSKLLTEFSDKDKNKLVDPIPNSEAEIGIGPFSILRALDIDPKVLKEKKSSVTIKPLCIETSLGYWIPSKYKERFEETLYKSKHKKRKKFSIIETKFNELSGDDLEYLSNKYAIYRDSVQKLLERTEIPYKKYLKKINEKQNSSIYDPFKDDSGFITFYTNFKNRIKDKEYIEKICTSFHSSPMPEIWDDYAAVKDFNESFFSYLEFLKLNGISRKVPKIILTKIEMVQLPKKFEKDNVSEREKIERKLNLYLKENQWSEDNWPEFK